MVRIAERTKLSATEYLAWEREQPQRHEFFQGEVFAMAGGSPRHNRLCAKVILTLGPGLESRGCGTMTSDQRVASPPDKRYVYPDVTIVCGKPEFQAGAADVLVNPSILFEVLSKTTADYDRGLKWEGYQTISSLTDYVLIAQSAVRVEQYHRNDDGTWRYRSAGPGERITIAGVELVVDALYAGVFDLPGDDSAPDA